MVMSFTGKAPVDAAATHASAEALHNPDLSAAGSKNTGPASSGFADSALTSGINLPGPANIAPAVSLEVNLLKAATAPLDTAHTLTITNVNRMTLIHRIDPPTNEPLHGFHEFYRLTYLKGQEVGLEASSGLKEPLKLAVQGGTEITVRQGDRYAMVLPEAATPGANIILHLSSAESLTSSALRIFSANQKSS